MVIQKPLPSILLIRSRNLLQIWKFLNYKHGRDRYETFVVKTKTYTNIYKEQYHLSINLQTGNASFDYFVIVAVFFTQVVRMLIVIVVLFGTLWLPYRIVVVYNSFQDSLLQFKDSWFWLFCRNMVFINSAINPIVYNMLSVKFRRAFRDIVCKGKIS